MAALITSAAMASPDEPLTEEAGKQKIARDGVSVEFMPSVLTGATARPDPMEGEDVDLRFWIRGPDRARLAGIRPAAWIDARSEKQNGADPGVCTHKIQSFLSGTRRARPQVDLNSFFLVVLNAEPVLSVIDPILGFGGSRLYTDVALRGPGSDWVLTKDQKHLFVSMPLANQVAVIDTDSWKVVSNVDVGLRPTHLALAADQKTLWVVNQNDDPAAVSVTVLDARTFAVAASLRSGRGPHRIAFASNGSVAVVTNGREGSVTLVDAKSLRPIRDMTSGPSPAAVTASSLSGALYAGDADGTISVIDPARQQITARIKGTPGLTSIRFAPDGRFGFVTIPSANVVEVIDSSNASMVAAIDVPKTPDQITFTDTYAYVRSAGADQVTMIRLADLGAGRKPNLADFPGGQLPPSAAHAEGVADAIISAPQSGAVFVANPADRLVYYYEEGMAAPMGNYQGYGQTPIATVIVDRSLRETEPGVFSIRTRVPAAGMYDVAFFLDSPRVVHCFSLAVRSNPELKKMTAERAVEVQPVIASLTIRANEPVELKFKLTNPNTGKTHDDLKDVRILTFLAPGVWQKRAFAEARGGGIYSITSTVPQPGVYYVFLECPSLGLRLNKLRPVILEATTAERGKDSP